MKRPVIIDTDMTMDDIVALGVLVEKKEIDIKAVTTVGSHVKRIYDGAETVCSQLNIGCKTALGAAKPVFKDGYTLSCVYGDKGLYDGIVPCCDGALYVWDVIADEAQKAGGQLEIITFGPLTNIAVTLLRYPHIKPLIKGIFAVAGANYVGNIAPYSEYNAFCDPDALQIVIDSGVPVVMCPLEAVQNCALSADELAILEEKNSAMKKVIEKCRDDEYITVENKTILYSAAAATAFLYKSAAPTKDYYVRCETRSGENQGWTIIDRLGKYKKEPNISVVSEIDREYFIKMFK